MILILGIYSEMCVSGSTSPDAVKHMEEAGTDCYRGAEGLL